MFDKFFEATKAQFIARPDAESQSLIFRHPDTNIPRGAKLTVRSDEMAVFFREGRAVGSLQAGTYQLDTQNIPFLGSLVNKVTGGNHYLAELFFVRTAENIMEVHSPRASWSVRETSDEIRARVELPDQSELGSFVDLNSRNLLKVLFDARVTVSVTDGVALITQLAGQWSGAGEHVQEIVSSRLRNSLKSVVAQEAQRVPIYEIISNAGNEAFGASVLARVAPEFAGQGLKVVRFLDLHLNLDEDSEELLRQYQKREADLVIDAKGAQVAQNNPGFAAYNAVKGGRSVAEGLGSGLSQGFSGPIIGLGGLGGMGGAGSGIGGVMPTRGPSPQQAFEGTRPSARSGPDRFIVDGPNGPEGPFAARQVALWVLASGRSPDSVRIRFEQDPADLWTTAAAEPAVMTELSRRNGAGLNAATVKSGAAASPHFESAFAQVVRNGAMSLDEMKLLVTMAVSGRMCANETEARAMIEQRAQAAGCRVEAPEAFAHWDGVQQSTGLSASDVVSKMRSNPGATHMVWTVALGNWTDVRQVPQIASLLQAATPPPPPPTPPPPPGR